MRFALVAFALLLSACGTPTAAGGANAPSGFITDAADFGNGRWFISCAVQVSGCTWRAAQLCPSGFDVLDSGASNTPQFVGIGEYATMTTRRDYQIMVQCR